MYVIYLYQSGVGTSGHRISAGVAGVGVMQTTCFSWEYNIISYVALYIITLESDISINCPQE